VTVLNAVTANPVATMRAGTRRDNRAGHSRARNSIGPIISTRPA
jgi:hypothetical protein